MIGVWWEGVNGISILCNWARGGASIRKTVSIIS